MIYIVISSSAHNPDSLISRFVSASTNVDAVIRERGSTTSILSIMSDRKSSIKAVHRPSARKSLTHCKTEGLTKASDKVPTERMCLMETRDVHHAVLEHPRKLGHPPNPSNTKSQNRERYTQGSKYQMPERPNRDHQIQEAYMLGQPPSSQQEN